MTATDSKRPGSPHGVLGTEGGIRIEVLAFARARELLAARRAELQLPAGSTVADCLDALRARHPALERLMPGLLIAVNESYAEHERALEDGDTVALIPPVSGG